MKLNLGCGSDIRSGWMNIDDCPGEGVYYWDLANGLPNFSEVVTEILAKDILEHLHRWEGVRLLADCYRALPPGGTLTVQVPDVVSVIESELSWPQKLTWLYGGQDQPQGKDAVMENARCRHPELFCHRCGFTIDTLEAAVRSAGFDCRVEHAGLNLICHAVKPHSVDSPPANG